MTTDSPPRLVFVGWGAIARTAAELLQSSPIEIVAVAVNDSRRARIGIPDTAQLISDPAELASCAPDVVAEAAGRNSVGPWGQAALASGADFIVSSASAFADPALLDSMTELARSNHAQLHIQPGALAGVEALAAASIMGIETVEHRIVKPTRAWLGTPAETLCDLHNLDEPTAFYSASAAETARAFPKNANVAMTTALAGIGPSATVITLVADPDATTNRHEVSASGAFGTLAVAIDNNALPDNPKTSALAALSLVRSIQNRVTPLVV